MSYPPPLQVPELWAHCAYPSLKPLASWIKDYHQRIGFMRAWLVQGLPACFWLPGFFFPQVREGTPHSEGAPPCTHSVCPPWLALPACFWLLPNFSLTWMMEYPTFAHAVRRYSPTVTA